MRPAGYIASIVGHIGIALMTKIAWDATPVHAPSSSGVVVPVEIIDIADVSNVRALAIPEPEDLETPIADQTFEEPTPEVAPTPAPTPRPPRERPSDSFDLGAAASLGDRDRQEGRERNEGQRADRNQQGAGLGTAEVAAIEDRIRALSRAHILRQNCWRMPIDLPDPERLVVTVRFELDRNGRLRGQPEVISPRNYTFDPPMRTAAEAALRAVRTCDPFPFAEDPVVGSHFDQWRQVEFTFRARL
jgi:hypothetical protein